jgi:hypothetical protein
MARPDGEAMTGEIPRPYHRWRANEEQVRPFGLLDRCLACGVLRYDSLVESSAISEGRRRRGEESNAKAAGPCPGERS